VFVQNIGRGMAKAPYLALSLPQNFRASGYGFDGNSRWGLRPLGQHDQRCFFGGDAGAVIHVGQALGVTRLEATVKTPDGKPVLKGPQTFRYELAAEDVELTAGEVTLDY
jgi:hypothetical protein